MPIIKSVIGHYDSINKKVMRVVLYYVPIAGLIIYFAPHSISKPLIGLILFIGLIILIFKVAVKSHEPFVCKDCGTEINDTVKSKGLLRIEPEPIMYYCEKCDILWHVGNKPLPG